MPEEKKAITLSDYDTDDPKKLNFKKGETLTILNDTQTWWLAVNSNGNKGFIPNNFVKLVQRICFMEVIHDWEADKEGRISVSVGDIVEVLNNDSTWWYGKLINKTNVGQFPSNFVKPITPEQEKEILQKLGSQNIEETEEKQPVKEENKKVTLIDEEPEIKKRKSNDKVSKSKRRSKKFGTDSSDGEKSNVKFSKGKKKSSILQLSEEMNDNDSPSSSNTGNFRRESVILDYSVQKYEPQKLSINDYATKSDPVFQELKATIFEWTRALKSLPKNEFESPRNLAGSSTNSETRGSTKKNKKITADTSTSSMGLMSSSKDMHSEDDTSNDESSFTESSFGAEKKISVESVKSQLLKLDSQQLTLFNRVFNSLKEYKNILSSSSTTESRKIEVRNKITKKLDEGKRIIGFDVIVRDCDGFEQTTKNLSIWSLLKEHIALEERDALNVTNLQQDLVKISEQAIRGTKALSHLNQLKLKFTSTTLPQNSNYQTQYWFSLQAFENDKFKRISEDIRVDFGDSKSHLRYLIKDISSNDMGLNLYLVCKVLEEVKFNEGQDSRFSSQLPDKIFKLKGGAIIDIFEIMGSQDEDTNKNRSNNNSEDSFQDSDDSGDDSQVFLSDLPSMLFYTSKSEDSSSTSLFEMIANESKEIEPLVGSDNIHGCVFVASTLFNGVYEEVLTEHPELSEYDIVRKLVFTDPAPYYERNSLYISLLDTKVSPHGKNLQMEISVRLENGSKVENCISVCGGDPFSLIQQRQKQLQNLSETREFMELKNAKTVSQLGKVNQKKKREKKREEEKYVTIYQSATWKNGNAASISELVTLHLDRETAKKSHLYVTLKNLDDKAIVAFSFLKLSEENHGTSNDGNDSRLKDSGSSASLLSSSSSSLSVLKEEHVLNSISSASLICDKQNDSIQWFQYPPTEHSAFLPTFYLQGADAPNNFGYKLKTKKSEKLNISISLASTTITQNVYIEKLLSIQKTSQKELILDVLEHFSFIDSLDIMKIFEPILDKLFFVFQHFGTKETETKPSKLDIVVYDAFLTVLNVVLDEKTKRFSAFIPVLEEYINSKFDYPTVYQNLINCLIFYLRDRSGETSFNFILSMKALQFTFKFIIASKLQVSSTPKKKKKVKKVEEKQDIILDNSEFKNQVFESLEILNQIMQDDSPHLIVIQTIIMKSFSSLISGLEKLLSPSILIEKVSSFLDSVRYSTKNLELNRQQLQLVYSCVFSPYYENHILLLLPIVKKQLILHLHNENENVLTRSSSSRGSIYGLQTENPNANNNRGDSQIIHWCIRVLGTVLDKIQYLLMNTESTKETQSQCKHMLNELSSQIPMFISVLDTLFEQTNFNIKEQRNDCMKLSLCILILFHLMDTEDIDQLIGSLKNQQKWGVITLIFKLMIAMISNEIFYPSWFHIYMFHFVCISDTISKFKKYFFGLEGAVFCKLLFDSNFALLNSKGLQLEKFSKAKQEKIITFYADLRLELINTVKATWFEMAKLPLLPIGSMIRPVIELVLQDKPECTKLALYLYVQISKKEYEDFKHLLNTKKGSAETLEKALTLKETASGKLDQIHYILKEFFSLMEKRLIDDKESAENDPDLVITDPEQLDHFNNYILELKELMDLLISYSSCKNQGEQDLTIDCTVRLMNYMKGIHCLDSYIGYIYEVHVAHASVQDFAEAAEAIVLHAELLKWNESRITRWTKGHRPSDTEASLKEKLYRLIIDTFEKAQCWELGLPLIHELAKQYERNSDSRKLSALFEKGASFYECIATKERIYFEYFRVVFYGKGWSEYERGQQFIYKGSLERLNDFVERIQVRYPSAELLKTTEPDPEILESLGQYLLVTTVTPSSTKIKEIKPKISPNVSSSQILKFYVKNDVNTFTHSKPFRKSKEKNKTNEFLDLWILTTYFVTERSFPGVNKRAKVIEHYQVEYSPIQNAINSLQDKNAEVNEIIDNAESNPAMFSPLSMALNGIIDAAVNGGVDLYLVFLESENEEYVKSLKSLLGEQLQIIQRGLNLHSALCAVEMKDLHNKLETFFASLKTRLTKIISE